MVDQKRTPEDDWFLRNERELLDAARHAREKREKERSEKEKADERQRLKDLHFMKCPKCGHQMAEETNSEPAAVSLAARGNVMSRAEVALCAVSR